MYFPSLQLIGVVVKTFFRDATRDEHLVEFYFVSCCFWGDLKKKGSLSLSSLTSLCSFHRGIEVGRTVKSESSSFLV